MKKLLYLSVIIVVCVAGIMQDTSTNIVLGKPNLQTVPTRTPKPDPTKSSGGGNGNGTQATNTAVAPTAIPTETPIPVTVAATPIGGFFPTAAACSNMPTIFVLNNTNVRAGPGTDYEKVGQLVFLEVRPIIGRAQNAEWWLITLVDGSKGWVANSVVNVSGYTDIIPVVPAPEIDGSTPTPGPEWNPTPNPSCTVTPTAIPTNTAVPTNTPVPTNTSEPSPTHTAIPEEVPTDTAVPPTETATIVAQPTRVTEPTPLATAVPLESAPQGGNSNWLLFGAGGLLIIGIIVFALRRRNAA